MAPCQSAAGWLCSTGRGSANAWVLEDDCDSEFRWEGKPLPPLATLDQAGQVIYCGTFSKTLAPALRIGFAIVPAPLVPAFVRLRTLTDRGTDAFTQATLAEFMRLGLLSPHIRQMRTEYARRRDALLEAMARIVRHATPLAAPGGLHMVARLADDMDEAAAVRACRARDLAVAPLARLLLRPLPDERTGHRLRRHPGIHGQRSGEAFGSRPDGGPRKKPAA